MSHPILSFEHVYVSRGDAPVLHDIHLTVSAGEHLAIVGPNGCGKSTLLKTITCELYPLAINPDASAPSVNIFGRRRWDLTELRKRLGVVSPDLPGKPTLHTSGFDAILTGFFSSSTLWPNLTVTASMRNRAEDLLHQVGAEDLRHKPVGQMSAGEQRRIMIARALAGSADMLLLDEPSNALDLAAQASLRDFLRHLAQQGTAILLITHHIADIIPEISRVLLMRDGRIDADGPKQKLLTAPVLSSLFGIPVEITERDGFFHAW